jgi:hypothetical protein
MRDQIVKIPRIKEHATGKKTGYGKKGMLVLNSQVARENK